MELKVWVEGIQRIVCGVSDSTTCQDVVLALAHAIGKSGKFTLIERWRNNERLLSPTEKPLKILLKWGEYSNDVQFILQHKDSCTKISSVKFHQASKTNSHTTERSAQSSNGLSNRINNLLDPKLSSKLTSNVTKDFSESQYKDLLKIVNLQKNKISQIEIDLNNTDSEIDYLEIRNKEQCFQFDNINKEIMNIDYVSQINEDQIQALTYLEKESELVKQQEKRVKSEIVTLRAKLVKSETELLQYKNKIQLLNEDLLIDQRKLQKISENDKHSNTINLLLEIEKIQKEIEESKQKSERHNETAESLKKELYFMESAINEKKTKIENLIDEMKEANLRSLMINPTDEVRFVLDNLNKNSSNRKIVGSPRQLENAVPTNKNPHGVWV